MPYSRYQRSARDTPPRQRYAALFIDYENLHNLLAERLEEDNAASEYIAEALRELRRYLTDEDHLDTAMTVAYADFNVLDDSSIERNLYLQGIEPRYVPTTLQNNASEVQLCIDAVDALHRRPHLHSFAVVSGNRTYRPLIQNLRRNGRHAFVAALDPPRPDDLQPAEQDVYMDLLNLLGDEARRTLLQSGEVPARRNTNPAPVSDYPRLDDSMLFRTLEITEEHFGQYEEVYLTPLLRKLSDVLGEKFDPKALVSSLEEARAVRLEKRRGYPYDYTVLIVNRDHPDVQQMEEDFYGSQRSVSNNFYGSRAASSTPDRNAGSSNAHEDREADNYATSDYGKESVETDYDDDEYDETDY